MANAPRPQPFVSAPEEEDSPTDHGWRVARHGNGEYVVIHDPTGRIQMGFKSYALAANWLTLNWKAETK